MGVGKPNEGFWVDSFPTPPPDRDPLTSDVHSRRGTGREVEVQSCVFEGGYSVQWFGRSIEYRNPRSSLTGTDLPGFGSLRGRWDESRKGIPGSRVFE